MSTGKHLSLDKRIVIESSLNEQVSLKEISRRIGVAPSTVSREIRSHLIFRNTGAHNRLFNSCSKRKNCHITMVCSRCDSSGRQCSTCGLCNGICTEYEEEVCDALAKPPYVCNGCKSRFRCTLTKRLYSAAVADKEKNEFYSESHSGFNLTEEEVEYIDSVVSPLLKNNGQSVHSIYVNNADKLNICEKSVYNLVHANILTARCLDLPRAVRYRPRQKKSKELKVDKSCRNGRTYDDFLKFCGDEEPAYVELDTVEGVKGGKCLTTFLFRNCNLQLAFIKDRNTSQSTIDAFNFLYETLGHEKFSELFGVILTDNGTEFSNPHALEFYTDDKGNEIRRCHIFYCNPEAPGQKGACEKNHVEIRRIVPKGNPFDLYEQNDINLMMSHINSYARKKLNNLTPIKLFSSIYGNDILPKLNIEEIDPQDVTLKPSILKK